MYTAILRMAYLGDGISSDYDDYPDAEQGGTREDGDAGEETPLIPEEDLEKEEETEENG